MYFRNSTLSLPIFFVFVLLGTVGMIPCPVFGQPSPGVDDLNAVQLSGLKLLPVNKAARDCLSGLLRNALESNPEIRAEEADLDIASGQQVQAGLRPNPGLEVELDTDFERWATADRGIAVGYSHTFERGGKREERVAVADLGYQVSAAQLADGRRNLASRLTSLFLQVLVANREIAAQQRLLDVAAEFEQIVAERVRVGEDPALSLNQARVEESRLAAELGLLQSRRRAFLTEMHEAIGLAAKTIPDVVGEIVVRELPQSLDQLTSQALTLRPDLRAARSEVEQNRAEMALLKAESVSDVVGFVRYSYDRFAFDVNGFNASGQLVPIEDSSHGVSLGINFDLPVHNRNQGNLAAALARIRSQEFRVSALEASVRRKVETAFERYRAARDSLQSLETDVLEQANVTLDALGKAYRLGELPFSEVLAEQRRVIDYELTYNEVMKEYASAAVELADAAAMLSR